MKAIFILLAGFALSACGNADHGKLTNKNKAKTASVTFTTSISNQDNIALENCISLQAQQASSLAPMPADMSGLSLCPHASGQEKVRLKASANTPAGGRYCLVPYTFNNILSPTCFNIDGQIDITLISSQYTDIALVRESDLNFFLSYGNNQTSSYPAFSYAQVR